jgi:hypothetical protein
MYKLFKSSVTQNVLSVIKKDGENVLVIPFNPANTDYQAFKSAVLNQQPGSSVVEDGDSFSLNTSPNDSILEDADGNVMTIDQAKEYVRTLP